MEKELVIAVEDLNKEFEDRQVLYDIHADFYKGNIYGIVGRNGSGKTVLLRCICGLTSPTAGKVSVNGKIVGEDIDFPDNIGFIIETPGFLMNYSGYKNLKYLASMRKNISNDTVKEYISMVGLDPEDKKHVGKYSLGMRQRLGIAQALMENPDILILDEPFNGLDNQGVEEMRKLFLQLKQEGKTILLASHNAEDIRILCDHVYSMDAGKMEMVK